MKILSITPDFQHPKVPGSHRHYHIIKELSNRHNVTLFTLAHKPVPDEVMEEMQGYTDRIYLYRTDINARRRASRIGKAVHRMKVIRRMRREFKRLIEDARFDVVLFHGKVLSSLLADCKLPVVIDFCDATSMRLLIQMRNTNYGAIPLCFLRYMVARRRENNLLKKSPHVAFISNRDRVAIVGHHSPYEVIPNGVDLEFWKPVGLQHDSCTLALTGVMNYKPNEDAALALISRVMPVLRTKLENPKLLLIGRAPTPTLKKEAEKFADITITGFVDDVRPWMETATLFAAPIRFASGMQNKVLEALAMKLPVITTSMVSQGVEIADGVESPVIVADDDLQFAEEVIRLFKDKERAEQLGMTGRAYVERHFSWIESAGKFERMCMKAVASAS